MLENDRTQPLRRERPVPPFKQASCSLNHGLQPAEAHMSDNELKAELERLRKENAALKDQTKRGVSIKVSEKGGVSVYGLGRFPVTLYKEQWLKLLAMSDEIRSFIATNDDRLKSKE
jgi:hypothetical protein